MQTVKGIIRIFLEAEYAKQFHIFLLSMVSVELLLPPETASK